LPSTSGRLAPPNTSGQPESPSSKPQWLESPELLAMLDTVNHMPPAHHAMAQIQAFEATPKLSSIPMHKICQVEVMGDNIPLVGMGTRSSETNLPCRNCQEPRFQQSCWGEGQQSCQTRSMADWLELPHLPWLESPDLPAWSEPLDLSRPELPDFRAAL